MKSLDSIVLKYPLTDKGPMKSDGTLGHNYTKIYQRKLEQKRNEHLKILEIGFGGGDSLKMWAEYFPNSVIYCLDNNLSRIDEYGYTNHERIKIFFADQSLRQSLEHALQEMGIEHFDIIIDEGSHIESHIVLSFDVLFDRVTSGGFYFVEDCPSKLILNHPSVNYLEHNKSDSTDAYIITIQKK